MSALPLAIDGPRCSSERSAGCAPEVRKQRLLSRSLMRAKQSPKEKIERRNGLALGASLIA